MATYTPTFIHPFVQSYTSSWGREELHSLGALEFHRFDTPSYPLESDVGQLDPHDFPAMDDMYPHSMTNYDWDVAQTYSTAF